MNFAVCLHAFMAKEMMAWKYDEIDTCGLMTMNYNKKQMVMRYEELTKMENIEVGHGMHHEDLIALYF